MIRKVKLLSELPRKKQLEILTQVNGGELKMFSINSTKGKKGVEIIQNDQLTLIIIDLLSSTENLDEDILKKMDELEFGF